MTPARMLAHATGIMSAWLNSYTEDGGPPNRVRVWQEDLDKGTVLVVATDQHTYAAKGYLIEVKVTEFDPGKI